MCSSDLLGPLQRQTARQMNFCRFRRAIGRSVGAGGQTVLGGDKDHRSADPLGAETLERLAADQEIAGGQDVHVLVPQRQRRLFHRRGRSDARIGHQNVPTADLNGTLSLSIVVLCASIYYGIKIKHPGGFIHELFSAPFGSGLILAPFNFALQLIEYAAKTVSLGMRLFGNMFAGELVFMLIALLGATATWWGFGLHFLTGLGWAIFHILIVVLQGFIFMMLTLVYIGQAHEGH